MRVTVLTRVPRSELEADLAELAGTYDMRWSLDAVDRPVRTLLMVFKEAHCLSDLLFRATSQGLPIDVVGVVGNHEVDDRSEERRVGKECRSRWSPYH